MKNILEKEQITEVVKIKQLINQCLGLLGYRVVKKKYIHFDYADLNKSIKFLLKKNHPIIFDIGANRGQSIKRFKKIFASY